MADPNLSADLISNPSQITANTGELEQRLGLYRVFLKLYEHHRELLDEILDLENTDRHRVRNVWQYVQAVIQGDQVYLSTNLLDGKSQHLFQPQHCWVIGRERFAGLSIQDKRLSRRHAMIQYVNPHGFYLSDLNSTNGTYLNGEAVRRPILLREGDRIRLGSLSFTFFLTSSSRTLATIPANLRPSPINPVPQPPESPVCSTAEDIDGVVSAAEAQEFVPDSDKDTFLFPKPPLGPTSHSSETVTPDLSNIQKADILDRFLNR